MSRERAATLNWPDHADLMFDQLETLVEDRVSAAEYCFGSPAHVTNDDEYRGKITGLRDALDAIEWLRELWSPEWYVTRHPLTGRSVENRSFWSILGWFTAETARWSLAATLLAGLAALWLGVRVTAGLVARRRKLPGG